MKSSSCREVSGGVGLISRMIAPLDEQEVAVKKLVGGGGGPMEKTLKDFKTECVLLSRLKHRNIIALVGATTHPVTCVMQYCSRGNLMVLLDDRR